MAAPFARSADGRRGTAMLEHAFVHVETDLAREERRLAVLALMRIPDPPDIRGQRKFRYIRGGDKLRQPQLKIDLEACYIRHRMIDAGRDGGSVISVRRAGSQSRSTRSEQ